MYYLKHIYIQKFKQIKNINLESLPNNCPWIFLTGENGFGKTILLQAIASALNPIDDVINRNLSSMGQSSRMEVILHGSQDLFGVSVTSDGILGFKDNKNFKFLCCYGSYRLETHSESDQTIKTIEDSGINRLHYQRTFLRNIEFELLRWKLKSTSTEISSKERELFVSRIDEVLRLFKDLLGLHSVTFDLDRDEVRYHEIDEDGNKLESVNREELGSGYRAILGFVGDLIVRLLNTQPDTRISDLVGIVIIDELELHLHPRWQRTLPSILSKYFPAVQFIASTHSPIPLLGAPQNSVFLNVGRSKEKGIYLKRLKKLEKEIAYLLPNLILTSDLFDLDQIDSIQNEDVESTYLEDTYSEKEENEKIRRRLEELDNDDIFPNDLFEAE